MSNEETNRIDDEIARLFKRRMKLAVRQKRPRPVGNLLHDSILVCHIAFPFSLPGIAAFLLFFEPPDRQKCPKIPFAPKTPSEIAKSFIWKLLTAFRFQKFHLASPNGVLLRHIRREAVEARRFGRFVELRAARRVNGLRRRHRLARNVAGLHDADRHTIRVHHRRRLHHDLAVLKRDVNKRRVLKRPTRHSLRSACSLPHGSRTPARISTGRRPPRKRSLEWCGYPHGRESLLPAPALALIHVVMS